MDQQPTGDSSVTGEERSGVPLARLVVYVVLCTPLFIRLHALGPMSEALSHVLMVVWEIPLLVFLAALHEYGNRIRSLTARITVRLIVGLTWVVLLLDAAVFHLFDLRLAIPDVIRYGSHLREAMGFIDGRVAGAAAVIAAGLLGTRLIAPRFGATEAGSGSATQRSVRSAEPRRLRLLRRELLLVIAVVALVAGAAFAPSDDGDLYGWTVQNWLSLSTQNSLYRSYKPAFLDSVQSELTPGGPCGVTQRLEAGPDVLIVVLESFSSAFSPMYGGSRSAHPELERISNHGLRFTRFMANGFTTEHGLIATLGGRLPVYPAGVAVFSLTGNTAFSGHYGLTRSLPACGDSLGYHTEFLTSGDLSFTNKGSWLHSIGFTRVEGHDSPYYDGLARQAFNSVGDSVLYDRVMDRIHELRADPTPFLLVVEGAESHGPYRGTDGMIESLRSADASLGWFYDQLAQSGFLETGIVLLVSDHRIQRGLTAEEREIFGPEAAARVPAVLLGRGVVTGVDSVPRHQLDVLPTLLRRMGGVGESTALASSLTDPPAARCIPWLHGGRRDEIGSLCNGEYVRIRLDAEQTRVVEGVPSDESDQLIAAIHRARIDGSDAKRQSGAQRPGEDKP